MIILKIIVFINFLFVNNKNFSSQIEYMIILINVQNNVNIIY